MGGSELVFAPEERDVYSYAHIPNGRALLAERLPGKAIALLRSSKSQESQPGYKHLAPLGRGDKLRSAARRFEMLPAAGLEFPGL